MTRRVALVTDSTAYLPGALVEAHDIRVVPLRVVLAGATYDEGPQTPPARVAEALRARLPVSTSRPAPQAFLDAYREAAAAGADGVVSVHLSAEISGTYDSAVLASREAPVPVRVVDSRSLGMGLGFALVAAAEASAAGDDVDGVAAVAEKRAAVTTVLFYVETLEHLRRGGRIGSAQALLGAALSVKPLLHLVDGRIEALEKVRTGARALARLVEIAVDRSDGRPVDVAVHHLAARERAEQLAGELRERLAAGAAVQVGEVGAVVGAHVGPGMLAVVIAPR